MKHLFKPESYSLLMGFLLLVLILKLLWFAVEMLWLPVEGINHAEETGGKALYYRVKLTPNEAPAPVQQIPTKVVKRAGNMNSIDLLAIYSASDMVIVTVSHKKKTKVLSRGEDINGFVLESASNNSATFTKDSKSYILKLLKSKKGAKGSQGNNVVKDAPVKPSPKSQPSSDPKGSVVDDGNQRVIDKSLLEHYAKNMDDIYKNIGISEVKKGSKLKGFKLTFIKEDSPFGKLGLQKGDILKSINGQELNSYNAAFNVYKGIKNVENLTLVIQRDKQKMELEYEIN